MIFNTIKMLNYHVKNIYFNKNKLDDECMVSLGELLSNNEFIENIALHSNNISDKGIKILVPYIIGNKFLHFISFSNNKGITEKSVPHFLNLIEKSNVINIAIHGTSITNKNIFFIPLVKNILKNRSQTKICFNRRYVYQEETILVFVL